MLSLRIQKALVAAAVGAWAMAASALGPHEIALLVNSASTDSVAVADAFVKFRGIPSQNVVRLPLPEYAGGREREITVADFNRRLWSPAMAELRRREVDDHILAWVYSVDFPTTVTTRPRMSVLGLTFLRGRSVESSLVEKGTYVSPLFTAQEGEQGRTPSALSFDVFREWLGADMPMPAMALGVTGERGNRREDVIASLERGRASDGSQPSGTVYFVTGEDIRSQCRQWQFPPVRRELRQRNVNAEIGPGFPDGRSDVVGLMMGLPDVDPARVKHYRPGCMAEHLTSAAGELQSGAQTKLSAWIVAGASLSAGAVTEPFSIWSKFPAAVFFVHYADGCTALESFYQSIRCPLQILLVGDPLACPWAGEGMTVALAGLPDEVAGGSVRITATVEATAGGRPRSYLYLLDGRAVGRDRELVIDVSTLSAGPHTLRAVAYRGGVRRDQAFVEKVFFVRKAP